MRLIETLLLGVLAGAAFAGEAAWPTFRGDSARSGCAEAGGAPRGKKAWTYRDADKPSSFASSPAVAGESVYIGADNGKLYCLDRATGKPRWTFAAVRPLFSAPVVADGRVYVGEGLHQDADCRLYCIDAASGRKLWEFKTASHVEFSPTVLDGRICFAAGDDGVYCLDAATGAKLWQHRGVHVDQSPAVTKDGVFFGSVYGSSIMFRLDPKDGRVIWKKESPLGLTGSPSADGGRVFFALGNGTFTMSNARPAGGVVCLSAVDGAERWRFDAKDAVMTTVAVRDGRASFGSRDGRMYCVDAASGKSLWTFDAKEPIVSSPATDGQRLLFGCDDGSVHCLDAAAGAKLWSMDTSNLSFDIDSCILSSPALAGGRVYIGVMSLVLCIE